MADPTNCAKDWIDVLTALLTPTIAIAGITIAAFQWKLNKDKYKHELFGKRWEQFSAIRDFMGKARSNGKVNQENEYDFIVATRGCTFLFNSEIKMFVDEVIKKADYLDALEKERKSLTDQEELQRNVQSQRQIKDWFESEINKIDDRFKKFLQLN